MNPDTTLHQRKLRLLGNLLLLVAFLGLLAGLILAYFAVLETSPQTLSEDPEVAERIEELSLPEGITLKTTVRELLQNDRTFFESHHASYRALSFLAAAFVLLTAAILLPLAHSWRKAVPFGRTAIIGLRCLGLLLVAQFVVGWIIGISMPEPWHRDVFLWGELYRGPIDMLIAGGPILSSGILFLILSWVLDYGRKIGEEQALTI